MTSDAPNVPSVEGAREALVERIADVVARAPIGPYSITRAVLPLVDAEVAAAVSEAQAEIEHLHLRGSYDLAGAETRAESAEAEVERLRGVIRQIRELAANARKHAGGSFTAQVDALSIERVVARPAHEAGIGEAGTFRDGVEAAISLACPLVCGGCGENDCPWCRYVDSLVKVARSAGRGEAASLVVDVGKPVKAWRSCPSCKGSGMAGTYTPNSRAPRPPCEVCGGIGRSPYPAPVVTPSAEGSE